MGPLVGLSVCVRVTKNASGNKNRPPPPSPKRNRNQSYTKNLICHTEQQNIQAQKHSYDKCCCTLCSNTHVAFSDTDIRLYVQRLLRSLSWLFYASEDKETFYFDIQPKENLLPKEISVFKPVTTKNKPVTLSRLQIFPLRRAKDTL